MTAIRRLRQAGVSAAGIRSALDGYGYGAAEFLATLQIRATLLQVEATVQLGEMLAEIGDTVDIVEAIRSSADAARAVPLDPAVPLDQVAFAAELDRHRRYGAGR